MLLSSTLALHIDWGDVHLFNQNVSYSFSQKFLKWFDFRQWFDFWLYSSKIVKYYTFIGTVCYKILCIVYNI